MATASSQLTLQLLDHAKLGAARSSVLCLLLRVRLNRFFAISLAFACRHTHTNREFRRAGAGRCLQPESLFHEPVFQRMERNDAKAASRTQCIKDHIHPLAECIQLPVHCNAQRLKTSSCRIFILPANGRRHRRGNRLHQLGSGQKLVLFHVAAQFFPAICHAYGSPYS